MIGTINIKVNASHPNMPLAPLYAFIGSPSQVRVIDVPKQIGNWKITAVQITANYPDNSAQSVECVLDGGCWHGTLPASTAVGQSLMGFKVTASGTDETGAAVTGYVLGKGDVFILNDDSTITIGGTTYYVHLLDAQPATPKKGDLCLIGGAWKIYNGTEWIAFGGGTGDVRHAEFADMTADLDPDESSMGDVMTKVNTLISKLKGTTAALVALLAIGSFAAVEVQTAKLSTLPGKTMVVTNVTYTSDLPSDYTTTNAVKSLVSSPDLVNTGAVVVAEAYADAGLALKVGTDTFTTATNVLATAITNKADKSELEGYLPLDGSVSMTGRLINDSGFQTSYYNGFMAFGSEHSAYYTPSDISYDQHVYSFPSKSGTFALTSDIPTDIVHQSTVGGIAYTNAAQILSSAENTAGTKIDRGYTPTNAVVALSRSVQYVLNPAAVTIQVPDTIPNGIRDWVVYVQNTALTDTIPLTLPTSVSWYGAETAYTNAIPAKKMTVLYFSEITTNMFSIGRQTIDLIQ